MHLTVPRVSDLATCLQRLFDPPTIQQLARQTGFVQRQRKLDPLALVLALVVGTVGAQRRSYKQLVADLSVAGGVPMAPQSLAQRLTAAAVALLLAVLGRILGQVAQQCLHQAPTASSGLDSFAGVWATDTSTMTLPASLAPVFPGCGGSGSEAAVKLHLSLDVLQPQLRAFRFSAATQPDALPSALLQAPAGVLHLLDKAYGKDRGSLVQLGDAQQFFATPLWLPLPLCDADGHPLDVEQLCLRHGAAGQLDQPVWLQDPASGRLVRHRLVGIRVPDSVAAARRRRLRKQARAKGSTVTARTLRLAAWVLVLTNVPPDRLSAEQVLATYRLRWQVELMFCRWKHLYGLRAPGYKRVEALYCHLVAALIAAALVGLIHAVQWATWEAGHQAEPSPTQATALFLRQGPLWLVALSVTEAAVFRRRLLERILQDILLLSHMQKRRRVSSRGRLLAEGALQANSTFLT